MRTLGIDRKRGRFQEKTEGILRQTEDIQHWNGSLGPLRLFWFELLQSGWVDPVPEGLRLGLNKFTLCSGAVSGRSNLQITPWRLETNLVPLRSRVRT